jgi:hypothetical protein
MGKLANILTAVAIGSLVQNASTHPAYAPLPDSASYSANNGLPENFRTIFSEQTKGRNDTKASTQHHTHHIEERGAFEPYPLDELCPQSWHGLRTEVIMPTEFYKETLEYCIDHMSGGASDPRGRAQLGCVPASFLSHH